MRYRKWKCEICDDEFVTDNQARWEMVWCKCGETAVDAEEWYTRQFGKPKPIDEWDEPVNQNKDE